MKRIFSFLQIATLTGWALWLLPACTPNPDSAPTTPPNVIFLLTDDQRWDAMGAMGNPYIQTPNMDALAQDGVMFTNAYVTTAICCTSRASILSGQYARRHGIHNFSTPFSDTAWQHTYPMLFKAAGYKTGFIGKYGVGTANSVPDQDFDYWAAMAGQPTYEQTDASGKPIHYTRVVGEHIDTFLRSCQNQEPFCLSVSFKAPHVQDGDPRQFIFDPAYASLLEEVSLPPPTHGDSSAWARFPDFFTADNEARRRWQLRFANDSLYQASVKGYYRLIYGVDVVIGEMRQTLKDLALDDNTLIVLMGDNGFYLGEHGMAGKWYGHEPSIRVPLVIYHPKWEQARRGQVLDQIALNIDVAPTLLDLAGLPIPEQMQGKSLVPLMQTPAAPPLRSAFFYEHLFDHPRIPQSEGVVSLDKKYLIYLNTEPTYEELYDLDSDPDEVNNLAQEAAHKPLLDSMRQAFQQLKAAAF